MTEIGFDKTAANSGSNLEFRLGQVLKLMIYNSGVVNALVGR